MTLREKFKSLNDKNFVKEMMITSVYGTMQLEGQPVSREKIERLYEQVERERQERLCQRQGS